LSPRPPRGDDLEGGTVDHVAATPNFNLELHRPSPPMNAGASVTRAVGSARFHKSPFHKLGQPIPQIRTAGSDPGQHRGGAD
jgi:hypothetical protein